MFHSFSMGNPWFFIQNQPRSSRGSSGDSHWGHGSGGREHLGQGRHRILRRCAAALLRGDQRGLLGASGQRRTETKRFCGGRTAWLFVDVFMQCIMCIIQYIYKILYIWYYNIYIFRYRYRDGMFIGTFSGQEQPAWYVDVPSGNQTWLAGKFTFDGWFSH